MVSLRRWSLVMSVAVVVGHVQVASYCYIELTRNRASYLHGPRHSRHPRPLLPLEVRRMQDV